jgi:hypothetical protein
MDVGLLSAVAVVERTHALAQLVQQATERGGGSPPGKANRGGGAERSVAAGDAGMAGLRGSDANLGCCERGLPAH